MTAKKDKKASWVNYIGLLILVICYIGALWNVFQVKKDELIFGKKVIRIAHWQLELGVVDALDKMAKMYEKENPDVKIIQLPVPEKAYAQWTVTQLIGRTAPDLIELGMFDVKSYLGRFFVPITAEVCAPNPYNADNPELKDVPWKETFTDGLQNCYYPELLDYYAVGLSQFTVRLFYNKTLFMEILGTDKAPKNLAELIESCDKIQAYTKRRNEEVKAYNRKNSPKKDTIVIYPISSSKYQVKLFRYRYASVLTADRCLELDMNYDGYTSQPERLSAMLTGDLLFEDEKYKVGLEVVKSLSNYFNPGFMSTGREDAGFAFVQGRAAMITSGSWDAGSYIKKINDQPFGDIILEVNGKKVSTAEEAKADLMKLAEGTKGTVNLLIDREGAKIKIKITPVKGKTIWESYGLLLKDITDQGKTIPVVMEIDSASPALNAGMTERKRFEVGFLDFPLPTKDDPIYGKYFVGRVAESADTGFKFGLVKFSENKKEALGFLQFCTTPKNNEELNRIAKWIPAVRGAESVDYLKAFEPNFKGYWDWLNFWIGNRVQMKEEQLYWPYISGGLTYEEYIKALKKEVPQEAAIDLSITIRKINEQVPDKHLRRSIYLAKTMFADDEQEKAAATKKFAASWDTVIAFEKNEAELKATMESAFNEKKNKTEFSRDFFKYYVPPEKH